MARSPTPRQLANPTTILSFVGIFAGLGVATTRGDMLTGATLVVGVFAGSALWWLCLSVVVGAARHRLTSRTLRWINALSGLVITAFGVTALLSLRG